MSRSSMPPPIVSQFALLAALIGALCLAALAVFALAPKTTVQAEVVDERRFQLEARSQESGRITPLTRHLLSVRYSVEGSLYTAMFEVTQEFARRHRAGARVALTYLQAAPSLAYLEGSAIDALHTTLAFVQLGSLAAWALAALLIIGPRLRRARQRSPC